MHPIQANPSNSSTYQYGASNNKHAQPRTTGESTTTPTPTPLAPPPTNANGAVSDALFRNVGATLKGATLGMANLVAEPVKKVWHYASTGTPQALSVVGGAALLGYGAVAAASAGTLFPILAGGFALGAGIQVFRGGYGAFSAESPYEQLKGFDKVGQALTLSLLAGASLLHYKKFWHAPSWGNLLPKLGEGITESFTKGTQFFNSLSSAPTSLFNNAQSLATSVKEKTLQFGKHLVSPTPMN